MSHGGLKRARSWKRRIQPKEAYSSPGLLYSETLGRRAGRQRVELTLWDSNSLREHAVALGYREAPATRLQRRWQEGSFSSKNRAYFVEYNATTSLTKGCPAEPFWFLDLFRQRVFRHLDVRSDCDLAEQRAAFHLQWGYESKSPLGRRWAAGLRTDGLPAHRLPATPRRARVSSL